MSNLGLRNPIKNTQKSHFAHIYILFAVQSILMSDKGVFCSIFHFDLRPCIFLLYSLNVIVDIV